MPDMWMDVDAAVTVPVNILPLIAVADFKAVLASETYNEAGLELIWNFVTTAGVQTHTAITPTDTGGTYDWVNVGHGMYNIELPAAVNDTEGFGWFTGVATDALPWRGPVIGFRAATLNNALIAGTDLLDVNMAQVIGTALTETSAGYLAAGIKKLFDVASPVLTAASVNQTGDGYARIGTNGAGLTALPWNASWDTEIESEVNDALVALNLDHLVKVAKDTNWATTVTKESIVDLMTSKNSGQTYDRATDALEAIQDNLTTVSAGVAATITATANTQTTGTLVAGTYADTYLSNGTYYTLAPVTPAVGGYGLNAYLTFGAASGQYINSVTIRGYFQNATGSARFCHVGAYNYVTNGIDVLSDSTSRMNHATANTTYTYALLSAHQKADGEVRIYFLSPSTTTGDRLNVDQLLVNVNTAGASAADIAAAVKQNMIALYYPDGVWLDTINGTDGTVTGTNGIQTFPVKTIAAAYALCASLNLSMIHFTGGSNASAVTLTQSAAGWHFVGPGVIDVGGQSIADAIFEDCYTISNTGAAVGDDAKFYNCGMSNGPFRHGYWWHCQMKNATGITLTAADEYHFFDCKDSTPETGDPATFIFAAGANLNLRGYQGGVQIKSMATNDTAKLDGAFRLVIHSSSTGGAITLRGTGPEPTIAAEFTAGGGTVNDDALYNVQQVNAEVDEALDTAIPGSPTADSINERIATMDAGVTLSEAAVNAILDDVIEGSLTMRQALRIYLAALAGKSSGGGTETIKFRNLADDGDRVTVTVDSSGNRTASTVSGA